MERQSKGSRGLEAYGKGGQGPPRAVAPSKKKNKKNIYIVSHHSSREHRALTKFRHLDTVFGEYFDFFPCFALMSSLFEDCSAQCGSGSGSLGVPF